MAERDVFELRLRPPSSVRRRRRRPTSTPSSSHGRSPRRSRAATGAGRGALLARRGRPAPRLGLPAARGLARRAGRRDAHRRLAAQRSSRPWCRPSARCSPAHPGRRPTSRGRSTRPGRSCAETMAFDRRAGRLVAVGARPTTSVETWTFDVCTNTWTQMHPDREPPSFDWRPARLRRRLRRDDRGLLREGVGLRPRGRHLDREGRLLRPTRRPGPTTRSPASSSPRTHDLARGAVELRRRDRHVDPDPPGERARRLGPMHAYDASVDRIVAYDARGDRALGAETWLFDLRTGTWSRSGAETPDVVPGYGWHGAAHRLRRGGGADGGHRRRPIGRLRRDRGPLGDPRPKHESRCGPMAGRLDMVYDPVNGRLVGWRRRDVASRQVGVVAFDLVTREWTVLLEPSKPVGPRRPSASWASGAPRGSDDAPHGWTAVWPAQSAPARPTLLRCRPGGASPAPARGCAAGAHAERRA